MCAGDAPSFSRSVQKKKPRDNWTMVSLTMPGLSLSPLGVAVKHIIRVMNALAGARARRTKKPLSLRGLIISQQLYRGIYASGNGGGRGWKWTHAVKRLIINWHHCRPLGEREVSIRESGGSIYPGVTRHVSLGLVSEVAVCLNWGKVTGRVRINRFM